MAHIYHEILGYLPTINPRYVHQASSIPKWPTFTKEILPVRPFPGDPELAATAPLAPSVGIPPPTEELRLSQHRKIRNFETAVNWNS